MTDPFAGSGSEAPPPYLGAGQPPGISERMQALMSRAEQEIAEQRQLQVLVGEVRQSLTQIQDEIRQAAGAHTLEIVRGEVTGLGAEVRSSSTMIGERLEAVVRAIGASAQVMQGVGQQLDRITELLNHQQQQINGLTTAVAQQRDVLGALPETVASRVTAPVEAVRAQVTGVTTEVAGLRDGLDRVTDAVRTDVVAVRERVDGVGTNVRDEVATLRDRVDGVSTNVRDEVAALRGRVDAVVAELRDELRADAAASSRALGDRVDAAVLALAEALLRPKAGGAAEAVAAPVAAAAPPWAGAASAATGDDSPAVEDGGPVALAEPPAVPDVADAPVGPDVPDGPDGSDAVGATDEASEATAAADVLPAPDLGTDLLTEDGDAETADETGLADGPADGVSGGDDTVAVAALPDDDDAAPEADEPVMVVPTLVPDVHEDAPAAAEEPEPDDDLDDDDEDDEDERDEDEDDEDDEEDDEDEDDEDEREDDPATSADAATAFRAAAGTDERFPVPDEVPLDAWSVDTGPEPAPEPQPSSWGWDNAGKEPEQPEEHREKRRPWWRPGG